MPSTRAATIPLIIVLASGAPTLLADDAPPAPRIDQVIPLAQQPCEGETAPRAVIWCDDFDDDDAQERYGEGEGETTDEVRLGDAGKSLRMRYAKGERGTGGRKVFFGDSPTYENKTLRRGETFTDVYWRIYVKHQPGWTGGGPAKLSRATSLVPPGWRQAMIAHVWSSGESLTLDPASGVKDGEVVTQRYNDFPNLRWLGNRPASRFRIHSTEESGWWICVEARAKLDTPGKKDGLQQLWIDGRLESERRDLDWRGTFEGRGINAVFLESYWNAGSPVDQSRWIDHFVVATEPIGPLVCPRAPVVVVRPPLPGDEGAEKPLRWELEIGVVEHGDAADARTGAEVETVVWRSKAIEGTDRVRVDTARGEFTGALRGQERLAADATYRGRVRWRAGEGNGSEWSPWHQTFRTGE